MTDPVERPASEPRPRRGRRWLLVLGALALLVGLAPTLLAPLVKSIATGRINERLRGTATVGDLSCGWSGAVVLSGVEVADALGQPALSLRSARLDTSLLGLLSGDYQADVRVEGLTLHVRQDREGRLNLAELLAEPPPEKDDGDGGEDETEELPAVRAHVELVDVDVVIHRPGVAPPAGFGGAALQEQVAAAHETTELADLGGTLRLTALDQPASFALNVTLEGPGGASSTASIDGTLTLARGGRIGADTLAGELRYRVAPTELSVFDPAAAYAGVRLQQGRVQLDGDWTLEPGLALAGSTRLQATGARLQLAGGEDDVLIPDLVLEARAEVDATLAGRQTVGLLMGEALELRYEGTTTPLAGGSGRIAGTLSGSGKLGALFDALREPLQLKEDLSFGGALSLRASLDAELADDALARGSLDADLGFTGLSATDATGRPVPLGELTSLTAALHASADLGAGTAEVKEARLLAGPVEALAHGAVAGLGTEELSVADSALSFVADLDRLSALLQPLVDLAELSLGGRIDARATVSAAGGPIASQGTVSVAGLVVRDLGPLDLDLRHDLTLDLAPGGAAELRAFALRSSVADLDLSGTLRDALDPEKMAGEIQHQLTLRPAGLATLLPGLAFGGADIRSSGKLALQGSKISTSLDVAAPAVTWGLADGTTVQVQDLRVSAASIDVDSEQGDLLVRDLVIQSHGLVDGGGDVTIRQAGGLSVTADLELAGEVEVLRRTLAAFVPELAPGHGAGRWTLALDASSTGERSTLKPVLELVDAELTGVEGLTLADADVRLAGDLDLTLDGERATIRSLSLTGPGLDVQVRGEASGLRGAPDPLLPAGLTADLALTLKVQPDELSRRLGALLGGLRLGGSALEGELELDIEAENIHAKGALAAAELLVSLADGRSLAQRDLLLDLDLGADLGAGFDALDVRQASYRSGTATASVQGSLAGLATPGEARADLALAADAELARALADLGALLPPLGLGLEGQLSTKLIVKGDAGTLAVEGSTDIARLVVDVPGETPLRVEDPQVRLGLDATIGVAALDVDLAALSVDSSFLDGTLSGRLLALQSGAPRAEGLVGDFTYVPDKLGVLLAPLLPGRLSGAEEERLSFRFDGSLANLEPLALLSTATAEAQLGLGSFALPALTAAGDVGLTLAAGKLDAQGDLLVNGGQLHVEALADLDPQAKQQKLVISLTDLAANAQMGELLGSLHPLLASAGEESAFRGAIDADLALELPGGLQPLLDALAAGGDPLSALQQLSGGGSVALKNAQLETTPLLSEVVSRLGVGTPGAGKALDIVMAPLALRIDDGRLGYDTPWPWKLAGLDTSFTGSVGLDRTLDLAWNLPVTAALVKEHGFLEPLLGEDIALPIRGTVSAPSLAWSEMLSGLAERAATKALEDKIKDKLPGLSLPGVLGGGKKKEEPAPAGAPQDPLAEAKTSNDPAFILKVADELWGQDKKEDARPLYERLEDDFKLTTVYLFNKDRIEERAKKPKKKKD